MKKIYYNDDLDKMVKDFRFVPYKLRKNAKIEIGKTYWCSKYQKWYKVLDVKESKIKIQWQNGEVNERNISLDVYKDYELKLFECLHGQRDNNIEEIQKKYYPINSEESLSAAEIKALCCSGVIDEFTASDLIFNYFNLKKFKPNDYVYYYIWKEKNYQGYTKTILERDLVKSPKT